jgi:hypothetical protein
LIEKQVVKTPAATLASFTWHSDFTLNEQPTPWSFWINLVTRQNIGFHYKQPL